MLKLGSKRRIRDRVDLAVKARLRAPAAHTGVLGAEVAVIVDPEENVQDDVLAL
jgi:hypothetical protein